MHKEIIHLFRDILLVCDDLVLIGREMFAIDGCKMPSNVGKECVRSWLSLYCGDSGNGRWCLYPARR